MPATARASDEPVRFDYRAPAGCPDAETFARRVESRTSRAHRGEPGELARTFVVEVRTDATGASARLSFTDARGAPVVRAVRGETCDEVVSAIALVTALAIEADPTEESASSPSVPASVRTAPAAAVPPAPSQPKKRTVPAPEPHTVAWALGVETGVASWLGPGPSLELGAFGEVGAYAGASGRLTVLGATSRALVELGHTGTFRSADFTALLARLEGCPVAAVLGSGFRVVPCAAFGFGQLEGKGDEVSVHPPGSKTIFWADFVPTLRLDWTAADSLVFFAQAEIGVPLVRHRFIFEGPEQTVFEVPVAGAGVAFGMAWRFP